MLGCMAAGLVFRQLATGSANARLLEGRDGALGLGQRHARQQGVKAIEGIFNTAAAR